MLLALKVLVEPVEGPQSTALEEGRITPREDLVQDMIESPFLVVVHFPPSTCSILRVVAWDWYKGENVV